MHKSVGYQAHGDPVEVLEIEEKPSENYEAESRHSVIVNWVRVSLKSFPANFQMDVNATFVCCPGLV